MPFLTYRQPGLVLKRNGDQASDRQIRDLQRDLRQLGYLARGIDGDFGRMTQRAVKALQHDLLFNDGNGVDGNAPLQMIDFNRSRIFEVKGEVTQPLVECISDLLDDPAFLTLPFTDDPVARNREVGEKLAQMGSDAVPIPFLMAILKQESGLKHFNVPRGVDEDTFIVVGVDTNSSEKHVITSRGFGAGQYTLFHHPPNQVEVNELMLDPTRNVEKAIGELREKFDHFVNGGTSGTRADDRKADGHSGPLRICKYEPDDPRYLRDCRQCALKAGSQSIVEGVSEIYRGSGITFKTTPYYRNASLKVVPVRAKFECDWPYAARRYNGSGLNSYHYQARVLRNVRLA